MAVIRIVANLATEDVAGLAAFYRDLLGVEGLMDQGWIVTLGTGGSGAVQLSIASEGGSGTAVPDLSVEVDDVNALHALALARGFDIRYPLTNEPWGVRRFYVADPMGRVINILSHLPAAD